MSDSVRAALASIVEGRMLTVEDARLAMGAVMDGEATPAQLAAMLMGLRMRGETVEELAGFASAMRERVLRVEAPDGTIDVVGTGGDGSGTFNISTAAALVVASTGVPVAKHGNRAITSRSGSADVLEALGIRIDHDAASAARALRDIGFAFMFAPTFHPAMRHAGPTRREIGFRTSFNLVGPLTNPAGARRALVGVGDASIADRIAQVAALLGTDRTLVVHGDRVDELPLDGTGEIRDVAGNGIVSFTVSLEGLGLERAPTSALAGGTAAENAAILESIFGGEMGPRRDVVVLNAGAAFVASGTVDGLGEGVEAARAALDGGKPRALLARLRAETADAAAATELAPVANPVGQP
ncbi:MAG TPA: anthranilate phosphoribosyltransferase [Candidatus Dormibacteraeota bacterium]|nr:anthranilate phosphoribosyltransferase [Candidatus Dormibacteraeota bacterium]